MKSGISGLLRRERETLKQFLTESKSPGCLTPGKPAKKSEKSALRQPVNLGPAEQSAAPALRKPQDIVVPSARLRRKALRKTGVEPGTKVRKKRVPEETCLFRAACCVRAGAAQEPGLIPRTEPADAEMSDRFLCGRRVRCSRDRRQRDGSYQCPLCSPFLASLMARAKASVMPMARMRITE